MSIRLHHRFSVRLALLGIGVVLIGLVFRLLIGLPQLQAQIQESVASQQTTVAAYVARTIDAEIRERRDLAASLARAVPPKLISMPADMSQWLREHQQLYPLFSKGLVVVKADGDGLIAEYPVVEGRASLDYSDKDWFIAARRSNGAAVGTPYRGRASGEPLIVMGAPVRDPQGRTVAILGAVSILNTPGFVDLHEDMNSSGGLLIISPRDRMLVASSEPSDALQPLPRAGLDPVYDKAMSGFLGAGIAHNAAGAEELLAVTAIPSVDWLVVSHLPTADAYRPVEMLRSIFVHSTLLIMGAVTLVLLVIVPRMLRPLTRAADDMRRMADGQMPLHLLPVVRQDEVGNMVAGFNALLEKLQQQEAVLREHETALAHMAMHDPLTGLPNRTLLEDRLGQALARAERAEAKVALLFCDLDGFKEINDTHGHEVGDEVLRVVANRLTDGRRRADTVARLGGDEFVILLPDLDDGRTPARLVAELCVDAMRRPIEVRGLTLKLGMSVGIALYPDAGETALQLLACADAAMYMAKRRGKGCYVFLDALPESGEVPEKPTLRVVKPGTPRT
jgi:diguanylate cyclase (GGDEF)-like protein